MKKTRKFNGFYNKLYFFLKKTYLYKNYSIRYEILKTWKKINQYLKML